MLRKIAFVLAVLVLLLGMSTSAFAQKTTVVRVIIVKTDNITAYLQAIESGKEMMKKIGINPIIRVYQATYAGPEAGAIAVTAEWPSMTALAEAEAKMRTDKDLAAWLRSLDKLRTIVSDSLYREL